MGSRIEKLTPEQSARLPEYRERWLSIGLSTQPTDRVKAEAAVDEAYRRAKRQPPKIKVWLASPMAGCVGAEYLRMLVEKGLVSGGAQVGDQVRAQVGDQVWAQVGDQVWAQVRAQVGAQVWDQVGAQVWDQVRAQVGDQVWAQVRAQVWAQVGAQVWDQVGAQVMDQVRAQVGAQVWDQVGAQVRDQVRDQVGAQVYRAGYGSHDANWLGFYEFFRDVTGLNEETSQLTGLIDLAQWCGWWWPFEGAVILTEKPTSLHRDDRGRLHNPNGAAIGYSDGWGVFAIHGVRVPRDVIESPASITVERIDAERNAEVRRVMIDRYGTDRFMRDACAKLVSEDRYGRLFRREVQDDEPIQMVHVRNSTPEPDGSIREFWLRVPPTVTSAHEAVAWTFGLTKEQYAPAVET